MKDTCPSIDEDDTDTDFPGANNNEESQATCHSIDGNKDADKFNSEYKNNIPMKTSRQCVRTSQAGLRQRTVPTSK